MASLSSVSGSDGPVTAPTMPAIGATVQLSRSLSYLKTAEARPMLRPPDLIDRAELGQVVAHHALGQCAVRFRRGTFLIEGRDLRLLNSRPDVGDG